MRAICSRFEWERVEDSVKGRFIVGYSCRLWFLSFGVAGVCGFKHALMAPGLAGAVAFGHDNRQMEWLMPRESDFM